MCICIRQPGAFVVWIRNEISKKEGLDKTRVPYSVKLDVPWTRRQDLDIASACSPAWSDTSFRRNYRSILEAQPLQRHRCGPCGLRNFNIDSINGSWVLGQAPSFQSLLTAQLSCLLYFHAELLYWSHRLPLLPLRTRVKFKTGTCSRSLGACIWRWTSQSTFP